MYLYIIYIILLHIKHICIYVHIYDKVIHFCRHESSMGISQQANHSHAKKLQTNKFLSFRQNAKKCSGKHTMAEITVWLGDNYKWLKIHD